MNLSSWLVGVLASLLISTTLASPTSQPADPTVYRSVNDVLGKLPKELKPTNNVGWDKFSLPDVQNWLDAHIAGAKMETIVHVNSITVDSNDGADAGHKWRITVYGHAFMQTATLKGFDLGCVVCRPEGREDIVEAFDVSAATARDWQNKATELGRAQGKDVAALNGKVSGVVLSAQLSDLGINVLNQDRREFLLKCRLDDMVILIPGVPADRPKHTGGAEAADRPAQQIGGAEEEAEMLKGMRYTELTSQGHRAAKDDAYMGLDPATLPVELRMYLRQAKEQSDDTIGDMDALVQVLTADAHPSEATRKLLAKNQEELANLKKGQPGLFTTCVLKRQQVGWVGNLDDVTFHVDQVIDPGNMIVSLGKSKFWVATDTAGLVDDQTTTIKSPAVAIIGTKTYKTTIGGSRTVFVFKPFDPATELKDAEGK